MKAIEVYAGSDGELTKRYYAALEKHGPIGLVAVDLFRANKCSTRAKVYRGGIRGKGSYKSMAYDRKAWSLQKLVEILEEHGAALGIAYGWKRDGNTPLHGSDSSWVLYVDTPCGQCSFHSPTRGAGPDYTGEWSGRHNSAEVIIAFCDQVYTGAYSESGIISR